MPGIRSGWPSGGVRRGLLPALGLGLLLLAVAPAGGQSADLPAARDLTGKLLVAAPSMPDPRFAETVIYMVRHNADGAFGVIINRRVGELALDDLLEGFGLPRRQAQRKMPVHAGGPVEPKLGFVLHSTDYTDEASIVVDRDFALTVAPKALDALAGEAGPARHLLVLGYSGWGPGQLEGELARDDWIVTPAPPALVFDEDLAAKWQRTRALEEVAL